MKTIALMATGACLIAGNVFAQTTVLATGLKNPMKVILTPGGNLLVSEAFEAKNASRISLVERSGARRTLIEGLPSALDAVGSASGPQGLAMNGRTIYVAIGSGDSNVEDPAGDFPNPRGVSSPLFCMILRFRFSVDVDRITAPFSLNAAQSLDMADGLEVTLSNSSGTQATADVLTSFRSMVPDPETTYRHSNPYAIALSPDNAFLYVADAGRNSLIRVDAQTGRAQRWAVFDPLPNYNHAFPFPFAEAVPDSVRVYGDRFVLVTLLAGFPFNPGDAKTVAVDLQSRQVLPFINNLNSAIDVIHDESAGRFFVLASWCMTPRRVAFLRVDSRSLRAWPWTRQPAISS